MPRIASLVLILGMFPAMGCSFFAQKTPTPAAQLDARELAQLPTSPGVRYYLIPFGSHDLTRRPAFTHTWAALVRAIDTPGGEPALEVHTISWLPTTLDIDPLRFRVEPGANIELHETIRHSLDTNQRIAMWGPYEVSHVFAHRFLIQKQFMESGVVGYQCIDTIGEAGREGSGCDCIHAITDMDPAYPRWRYPLAFYGQPATANLVRRIMHSPVTINGEMTHDWLVCRLGLDQYKIERRQYRGRIIPYVPGAPDLQAAPILPLPRMPIVPKEPDPKTAPGPKPPNTGVRGLGRFRP